eukprot:scaffold731_cov261-Pinguiococcus_pyrenoidosus.AAC.84
MLAEGNGRAAAIPRQCGLPVSQGAAPSALAVPPPDSPPTRRETRDRMSPPSAGSSQSVLPHPRNLGSVSRWHPRRLPRPSAGRPGLATHPPPAKVSAPRPTRSSRWHCPVRHPGAASFPVHTLLRSGRRDPHALDAAGQPQEAAPSRIPLLSRRPTLAAARTSTSGRSAARKHPNLPRHPTPAGRLDPVVSLRPLRAPSPPVLSTSASPSSQLRWSERRCACWRLASRRSRLPSISSHLPFERLRAREPRTNPARFRPLLDCLVVTCFSPFPPRHPSEGLDSPVERLRCPLPPVGAPRLDHPKPRRGVS